MESVVWAVLALAGIGFVFWRNATGGDRAAAKREAHLQADAQLICPHCQTKGQVTSTRVSRAKGISGGKAAGALVTGGLSIAAVGLSRQELVTKMTCANCATSWDV